MGTMKKKLDQRIRTLIENGIHLKHRSLFVIIGDQGNEQVVNLHYILSKSQVAKRPTILWCYKKDLGFSSHRKKRMRQMKKKGRTVNDHLKGEDAPEENPFELFLNSTEIHYTYYSETDKILGNTFGMLILQDFEALSPNLLARTIETVSGGGIVVLLLKTLTSLKQFYTMTMDVHSRYRSSSSQQYDIIARFNERFLLSLTNCASCLILDDALNVLSISSHSSNIVPIEKNLESSSFREDQENSIENQQQNQETLDSIKRNNPNNHLLSLSKTLDQAKVIQNILQVLKDPKICNKTTISITAARGRGKSAALGIALAAIISQGYGNVFITAPHPENLQTLFEFLFKGLDALGYQEHLHYDIIQSLNPNLQKAIVRINIFKDDHRQTIMYIQPQDVHLLGQAELVLIDEAAAIPLPLVQSLINGPYLVMIASTINGYEGTGRSLSLKLLQQLRSQTLVSNSNSNFNSKSHSLSSCQNIRILKELELSEPIRYSLHDPIENWLNQLLCLDATSSVLKTPSHLPHPDQCHLYSVNRNTLFSYHKASETFLQRLIGLFVASHYKNTPNDLQLMSDAPAHRIFVLLPPIDDEATFSGLPDILCAIHVCYEGSISKQVIMNSFVRGKRAAGDLIPWTISQQFQDGEFAGLSGARIVRIAVHPDLQRMGYGKRALNLLEEFYRGNLCNQHSRPSSASIGEVEEMDELESDDENDGQDENIENDSISLNDPSKCQKLKPKANLKPLLTKASDKKPIKLHWLGVSFGLTEELYKFWNRNQFKPVYLRQTTNDLTGEHTIVMLKTLLSKAQEGIECSSDWLESFYKDFRKRFSNLLSFQFRNLSSGLCLDILNRNFAFNSDTLSQSSSLSSLQNDDKLTDESQGKRDGNGNGKSFENSYLTIHDLKRLESYSQNMVDYHLIMDLIPFLSMQYFIHGQFNNEANSDRDLRFSSIQLSPIQSAILLSVGLQKKKIEDLERDFNLPSSQLLAIFVKCIRKFVSFYKNEKLEEIKEKDKEKDERNITGNFKKIKNKKNQIEMENNENNENNDSDEQENEIKSMKTFEGNGKNLKIHHFELSTLENELDEAGQKAMTELRSKQMELLKDIDLAEYEIDGNDMDWAEELTRKKENLDNVLISVKKSSSSSNREKNEIAKKIMKRETMKKEGGNESKSKGQKSKLKKK